MNLPHIYNLIFVLNICLLIQVAQAQDPTYYTIGENELNETDIYSILESNNGNIFIAGSDGLYRYSSGKIVHYPLANNQKGSALFFLVEDTYGNIFCNNLKGQVFKVGQENLHLYHEILPKNIGELPYLLTDKTGNLFIISKCIEVHNKGQRVNQITNYNSASKNWDSNVVIRNKNKYYIYPDSSYWYTSYINTENSFFYQNLISHLKQGQEKQSYHVQSGESDFSVDNRFSNTPIEKEIVWSKRNSTGIQTSSIYNSTLNYKNKLFEDIFVSTIAKGKSGLIYLGSFKQGIRVIPNYNILELSNPFPNRSIIDFDINNSEEIYCHIRGQGLIYFNAKSSKVSVVDEHYGNQNVFVLPRQNLHLSDQHREVFTQKVDYLNKLGGVKNINIMDNKDAIFASSLGLFIVNNSGHNYNKEWIRQGEGKVYKNSIINERCLDVTNSKKTIYVASHSNLWRIINDEYEEIKYKNKSILANSIAVEENKLYIGSSSHGVLVLSNNKTSLLFNKELGLADNNVEKLVLKDQYLFVLNKNFLQCINLKNNNIIPLNKSEGIIGYINNFHVIGKHIYILTDNTRIIKYPIDNIPKYGSDIDFVIDSILVNGTKQDLSKPIKLAYYENNIVCHYHLVNDAYREQTNIKYQLIGFDNKYTLSPATTNEIRYKNLSPGNYTFNIKAQYGNTSSTYYEYPIRISYPFWKRWWFILIFTTLSVLLILKYFRVRLSKQKREAQKVLLQKQTETDLIQAKLTALRSQMNPHFIFNALNSIQNLILQADTTRSYDYIVLFSKLVRSTLNYSETEYISIDDEVDFLDIYLQLEKLRFNDDFQYTINNLCDEMVYAPPLIIQPFVENALLHGLLSKKGIKRLNITFEINNEQLLCTIEDNGIGRKKSKEIQKRQGKKRKSFALNAIQKRLDILQKQHVYKVGYSFIDLHNDQGMPTGTKVVICLPYQ